MTDFMTDPDRSVTAGKQKALMPFDKFSLPRKSRETE